jgi:N-acyl-D-aspartate/D-glutamate deacylase
MDGDPGSRGAVGIADGVCAALGDPGQQGAGGDCPLDAAPRSEAISGYSAQSL